MKKRFLSFIAATAALLTISPMAVFADDAETVPDIPESERSTLFSSTFEDKNIGKWTSFGGNANLTIGEDGGHESNNYLNVSNRVQTWNGPSVNCDSFMTPGDVYYFDGWVRHDTSEEKNISWTLKYIDSTGMVRYIGIDNKEIPVGEWMKLSGKLMVPDDATAIDFYFECSNATADFKIDDITVTGISRAEENDNNGEELKKGVVKAYDFEKGKEGWNTRGDERLIHTDECSYTGKYSIYSSGRTKTWNGPSVDINDTVERDKEYFFSAYVFYNGKEYEDSHKFRFETEYTLDGSVNYMLITDKVIEKNKWTEISGFYTIPAGAENARMYIQTDNLEEGQEATDNDFMSFYVDNVTISDGAVVRRQAAVKKIIFITIGVVILAAVGIAVYMAYKNMKKNKMALEAAEKDAMTHAFNRNTYEQKLNDLKEDPEQCKSLYFALCDVNFLKYINDNFGHKCGDEAIIRCAEMLTSTIGYDGDVYRTGGDEFVVIGRKPIKDKIMQATAAESKKESEYPFAVAAGFAQYDSKLDGDTPDITKIVKRCDEEMYKHKQQIKADNKQFSRK